MANYRYDAYVIGEHALPDEAPTIVPPSANSTAKNVRYLAADVGDVLLHDKRTDDWTVLTREDFDARYVFA